MFKILEALNDKRAVINNDIGYITGEMDKLINKIVGKVEDIPTVLTEDILEDLELLRTFVSHLESNEEICIDTEYDDLETEIDALYVANVEKNDYLFKKKFYGVVDNFLTWSNDENK